ncbi:MAG: heterodisulfide reductase-related iron-sulfur binding cluster [Actinomycetota bacterium]|nr:heterodisulfide reductase-related iron-sulfur binding cluster [Actinomycetota bacterium]
MVAGRAFDDHHPPEEDLLETCVHVGFCLPSCPTYLLWGEEMDSPRGRITLMQVAMEEGSRLTDQMVLHWDRCLGCMACVTACPAGVRYEKLIEATRTQVERNYRRPPSTRLLRRALLAVFTHPGRLRALVPLLAAYRRLGLRWALRPLVRPFPHLRVLESLAPAVDPRVAVRRLPELTPAVGERRGRVGLLQGCVQRVLFHQVNEATARVLAAEGFEVFAPRLPRCCGALMLHSGCEPEAVGLARQLIEVFEDCDLVVVNAAGCGSSMKDYGYVLRDDPQWAEPAARFSAKVRDVTELLAEEPLAERRPVPLRVAYHDACHLAHAQGLRQQPRRLLAGIPGVELVEPAEWEICCGSAGIYNIFHPEAGEDLGRRKARSLLATGAEAIASANPGCTLQIRAHLEAMGERVPIYHPVELVDHSISGGLPSTT